MKRFHLLRTFLACGASVAVLAACSAGDGDGDGEAGSEGAAGDSNSGSGDGDGDVPDGPTGDGDGETADSGDSTSNFEDYAPSCDEQECEGDEVCKETQSGSECFKPCPGQPCPPVDGLVSYCDRQGGVSCFEG